MKKKIYCSQCRYYIEYTCAGVISGYSGTDGCSYEDNVNYTLKLENWYSREQKWKNGCKRPASEINAKNDCKWFKRKLRK